MHYSLVSLFFWLFFPNTGYHSRPHSLTEGANRMKNRKTPYKCHLFVCTRSRNGEQKACADGDSSSIKLMLKDIVNDRGWKGVVRISESGCQGVCSLGPNLMIYPQGIWLSQIKPSDVPEIVKIVEEYLDQ